MGVYNPNMEMPRNCTECIEFKDDCEHYWDYYCTHESRPNDCPLIEIDEPKVGNWIEKDGMWCDDPIFRCSACGEEYELLEGTPIDVGMNYCPNCGAKMERRADD